MALKPGTMLGPYEVVAQIGAGGMGEVYKGLDTRLNRDVAIKVLPEHLALNAELRERPGLPGPRPSPLSIFPISACSTTSASNLARTVPRSISSWSIWKARHSLSAC